MTCYNIQSYHPHTVSVWRWNKYELKHELYLISIPLQKVDEHKKDNIPETYIMPYNNIVLYTLYR